MCTAMLYEPQLAATAGASLKIATKENSEKTSAASSKESSNGFASKLLNWFRKK